LWRIAETSFDSKCNQYGVLISSVKYFPATPPIASKRPHEAAQSVFPGIAGKASRKAEFSTGSSAPTDIDEPIFNTE